jgi:hypothetical protein
MIRLELAGAHTRLGSTLCAECPQGVIGCCVSPPGHGWADLARIVARGGRDFLLQEMIAGNLVPGPDGLALDRVRQKDSPTMPRRLKCVYHGLHGCTIAPDHRPSTCNYYLCADAFTEGGAGRGDPAAGRSREAYAAIRDLYIRWNRMLAERVAALWPEPRAWDPAFLDWLGASFAEIDLEARARGLVW